MNCSILNTTIGRICILGNDKISEILIGDVKENPSKITEDAKKQLEEYFLKKRKTFTFEIEISGTDFQKRVLKEILNLPYSKTMSYSELSKTIFNSKKYARPIGNALNKNPLLIVVPCHRITSTKGIGGYNHDINIKEFLLNHESLNI